MVLKSFLARGKWFASSIEKVKLVRIISYYLVAFLLFEEYTYVLPSDKSSCLFSEPSTPWHSDTVDLSLWFVSRHYSASKVHSTPLSQTRAHGRTQEIYHSKISYSNHGLPRMFLRYEFGVIDDDLRLSVKIWNTWLLESKSEIYSFLIQRPMDLSLCVVEHLTSLASVTSLCDQTFFLFSKLLWIFLLTHLNCNRALLIFKIIQTSQLSLKVPILERSVL